MIDFQAVLRASQATLPDPSAPLVPGSVSSSLEVPKPCGCAKRKAALVVGITVVFLAGYGLASMRR